MTSAPTFSLLVVTTNRLPEVRRLFTSLCQQTFRDFSLIFAYEVTCADVMVPLISEFKDRLAILAQPLPHCGISEARNRCLPRLTGSFVAFPDDDCVYAPDTLEKVASIFTSHPKVDAVLGRRVDIETINTGVVPEAASKTLLPVNIYNLFTGSETFVQFISRACVDALDGFDEKLGAGTKYPYGCGEDTDYILRIYTKGFTVVRALDVIIGHKSVDYNNKFLLKKTDSYANGRMYLLRKHHLPWWFRLVNVLYPLACLPLEVLRSGIKGAAYRWCMFVSRTKYL
ncbi:glycosyltransferase [Desulfovibrio desulfuricans]|uniref:glycosyltransferase family 2 protein n=1 Tax=Desulfovibrio desulfuricans TaxID=876 RepID=UPI001D084B05|nr:glycosyltransferase family 2 protein [Desulfovibrio desulfuricans]MCB6543287.1 glycosyltransferase [Desulfovibrio desulfuricans]MCB6554347.1 glycosyltransferase [Desulfovibrio desulfuricans]MCB6566226.1 glycosyltransferase [Desulfovibrio desulfuricans]MCB7347348.1 glycosyltransferase [Desulfovibrio desulfuricans]MCQ5217595.1 glycosyltransferase [Desulfovibrio desulfuricans]